MLVAKDLNLHVTSANDHLFQVAFAVAKSGFGLAAAFADLGGQFGFSLDRAHAAATATPRCLQHQRITDFGGLFLDGLHVVTQHLGGGDHRNTGFDRHTARAGLVT